jgi:hypothetical protein
MSAHEPMFRGDPNVRIGNFVVEITDVYGRVSFANLPSGGQFVATVFRGEKPDNVPVQQPTNFKLVINLKTATAIGPSFCCAPIRLLNKAVGCGPNETQPNRNSTPLDIR